MVIPPGHLAGANSENFGLGLSDALVFELRLGVLDGALVIGLVLRLPLKPRERCLTLAPGVTPTLPASNLIFIQDHGAPAFIDREAQRKLLAALHVFNL